MDLGHVNQVRVEPTFRDELNLTRVSFNPGRTQVSQGLCQYCAG